MHNEDLNVPCFLSGIIYALSAATAYLGPVVSLVVLNIANSIPGLPTAIDCLW